MKFSLNLAQQYSNVDLKSMPHNALTNKAGAQLGGIEEVINYAPKYEGVVVVKIVECVQHPNADRLHVCKVDDGGKAKDVQRDKNGLVQVVCGAPNAREGILVAWLPPGSTVPASRDEAEPFVLDARELRGKVSNGMLASAKELGISDDHDGILQIDDAKPGDDFVNCLGMDDFVMDFENKMFTHRPDCFGHLGVARELAGINQLEFKSPDWYIDAPAAKKQNAKTKMPVELSVTNKADELVPRLMAVAMSNVVVSKSPVWLVAVLNRLGMKSINNVVDATNYVMNITGQPLHAYDADKLGAVLTSRMAKKGEKVALLNGKTIELTETDIVMANAEKVVGLAGIMGGTETEVDETTKNIVIECATFDMYTIRRSSMHHGLFTDASTRYTKGQSPLQNDRAVWYAMKQMQELAGAQQSSDVYDVHEVLELPAEVVVTAGFINDRLGSSLSLQEIAGLLHNVEFTTASDGEKLRIQPPFWRTDIEIPEDIVEEIGRLHGYEGLPAVLPARPAKPTMRNKSFDFKQSLRRKLAAAGANEVLTYSFVHGDLLRKTGTDPDANAYHIRNAISPDLQYYRTSLMPSLLDKVRGNLRADLVRGDDNEFALFEIGTAHIKGMLDEENLPLEMQRLALVFAADSKTTGRKYGQSAFYQAKKYLSTFIDYPVSFVPLESAKEAVDSCYQMGRSAAVYANGQVIGVIGEFTEPVKKALKLPDFCAGFELDVNQLMQLDQPISYAPVSNFPKIQADMTFEVGQGTEFAAVYANLHQQLSEAGQGYVISVVPRDIFKAEGSEKKRMTFRVWLSHSQKTLKTAEVNRLLDAVAGRLKQDVGAERI